MKRMSEGWKMWFSVMGFFIAYAAIFLLFDDFDRKSFNLLNDTNDWNLLWFSMIVVGCMGLLLIRFTRQMDRRIKSDQKKKQTETRREMTQNIGHELRTPVASILGYTETIIQNPHIDEETRMQFVYRTNAHARRLTALLNDLSTLNKMDISPDKLRSEEVNISEMVENIVKETDLDVRKHNMTVNNLLPQDIIIQGDWHLIYSIFRNLVDNAIKYAGDGSTIEISAKREKDEWHFVFADNGKGVENKHLNRLFERFYRTDKGRSRELGGTGLGLAIVKNAVMMYGGEIMASQNDDGKGLKFTFNLKTKPEDLLD